MSTLFAFLHHLAAFTLVSAVAVEFVLLHLDLTVESARRLQRVDRVLGAAAGALLVIGLLRVAYFEKGPAYYFASQAFMAKLSVFIALAALSVAPTLEFLSWRRALQAGDTPDVSARKMTILRAILRGELIGIVVILLCAAIMARGGWV